MTWSPDILSQGEIHALREAAERAWGEDTRDPVFQGATPAAGQCYNTSRWLQERLGGSVGRVHGHYVWMSPDHQYVLDLTGDQFGGDQMLYKPISHHVFAETQPLDPEEIQMIDGPDTDMFVKRANREFEGLGSTISKIALDYAGDAYPAEMPQRAQDLSDPYFHREQPYEQPSKGEYNFVYANDQVEVSPFHDHEDLAQQAGIDCMERADVDGAAKIAGRVERKQIPVVGQRAQQRFATAVAVEVAAGRHGSLLQRARQGIERLHRQRRSDVVTIQESRNVVERHPFRGKGEIAVAPLQRQRRQAVARSALCDASDETSAAVRARRAIRQSVLECGNGRAGRERTDPAQPLQ